MSNAPKTNYINRHLSYINNRIISLKKLLEDRMYEQIDISFIINFIMSHNICGKNIVQTNQITALEELKNLTERWDIAQDGDIVGYIYQQLKTPHKKKLNGQFFTPHLISDYICNELITNSNLTYPKILDPACGSGQFLISSFLTLLRKTADEGISQAESVPYIIQNCIHGFDIDPIAVNIARFNLSKLSGIPESEIQIYEKNFLDALPFTTNKFNIVLGNPPWGGHISKPEKEYYKKHFHSTKSGINTFTLFIEQSISITDENGHIGFLIPEAFLNIKAHCETRKLILTNSSIEEITLWGEQFKGVFAPSISLLLKMNDKHSIARNVVKIKSGVNGSPTITALMVPQAEFHNTHENIFNINYSRKCVNLISTIEDQNCEYLKNNSKFFLGVVSGDNSKYISKSQSEDYPDPIIIGKDINQYNINFSGHYFKFDPSKLQQVAPQELYLNKDKIFYKFIGEKLTFALDKAGYYSLNNANGFIPNMKHFYNETIVSILNSELMQYYYTNNFFTLKVLKGNLERLPLKKISKENQKKIKKFHDTIAYDSCDPATYKLVRQSIEDIIYYEYGISDRVAYGISGD